MTFVLVSGCSSAPPPPSVLAPVPPPPPAAWQPCGNGFDCARVRVPDEYTVPDGPTVDLGIIRHRATGPGGRLGSLFVNPGGPGVPAEDMVRVVGTPQNTVFGPEVLARYDVVGMDPRGVGSSAQLQCFDAARREALLAIDWDVRLPGGQSRPALEELSREVAAGCAAHVDKALLGQLSTDVVARDMDQVRLALGEERISYLGLSYGTLLGATYATLFPQRVRHMVLDAPVDQVKWQRDPLGATVDQTVSAETVLNRYFATCVAEGVQACPFGAGNPAEAFDALVARLEAQPLRVPPDGNVPEGRVDGAVLLTAARIAGFDPKLWPVLTATLTSAEGGDGALARTLAEALSRNPKDRSPNGFAESLIAVSCLDRAFPTDPGEHDRNAEQLRAAAPRYGTGSGYLFLPCTVWPVQNPDRYLGPLTAAGAPPVLVLGGREDSQTPYPWAEAMVRSMPGSVLLTRDGPGHGALGSGPCTDRAVERYLTTGEMPAEGTVCPREPVPTTSLAALGR